MSTSPTELLRIIEDDGIFALDVLSLFQLARCLGASRLVVVSRGIGDVVVVVVVVPVVGNLQYKGKHSNVAAVISESREENHLYIKSETVPDKIFLCLQARNFSPPCLQNSVFNMKLSLWFIFGFPKLAITKTPFSGKMDIFES